MNFGDLFQSVINYFTSEQQDTDLNASLEVFTDYLNGPENEKIRMFIADTPGYGHQTSTVNMLFQLVGNTADHGLGYVGVIDLYYEVYKKDDDKKVLDKIFQLLPSLNNQTEGGNVNGVPVNLIKWKEGDTPPVKQVNLGFTGAADQIKNGDDSESSPQLAMRLNTIYFLRLEPYGWTTPEEIQFNNAARKTIVLTKEKLLNYDAFRQRAYYTELPVPEPIWQYYIDNGYSTQVAVLQSLLSNVANYNLGVAYSIRTKGNFELRESPEDRMFQVITSYMASQMNGNDISATAKPIVVLSMDTFEDRTGGRDTTVGQLIEGGRTANEQDWFKDLNSGSNGYPEGDFLYKELTTKQLNQLRQRLKPSDYRSQYLKNVDATERVDYVWEATLENVTEKYVWLNGQKNRVLFVQIGRVPPPIFDYLMYKAALPAVFEGQNTGNLALQFGRPYLHVARPSNSNVQYPTTLLGYNTHDVYEDYTNIYMPVVYVPALVYKMQKLANLINYPLELWPADAGSNPAEQIGAFITSYMSSDTGEYQDYYKSVSVFYQNRTNDKFRVGASFLGYVLQSDGIGQPGGIMTANKMLLKATGNPMATLLQKLYDNLGDDQQLNLFPGVYDAGPIFKFISGLLGVQVSLTGAAITPSKGTADPKTIVVTGTSTALDGMPLDFTITFTAPDGSIISDWKMVYAGTWLTEQLPWLLFKKPYVLLTVADTLIPAQGGVGGILDGLDLDLSIRMPIEQGVWQLEGHFEEPASVSKFYQLSGGVNLVQSLPSPFNAFSAIGVTDCQMAYNAKTKTIEYISFVMATSEPVQLMQGLQMEDITFNVLVLDPGSVTDRTVKWSVMGKFLIGTGTNAGVVITSMAFPGPVLTGQLASGEIRVTDLFNLFLPGTVFNPEGYTPVITEFAASFDGTTGDYSVVANLNFDWTFQIIAGAPAVTINQVGVNVQKQDEQLAGGISGGFTFGQGDDAFSITVSADYTAAEGWVFSGLQEADNTLKLTALANQLLPTGWTIPADYDYSLKNLSFTFRETKKYYEIGGETDGYWTIPFIDLQIRAALKFGYGTYGSADSRESVLALSTVQGVRRILAAEPEEKAGYYCSLNADIKWLGIEMSIFYDYNPNVRKFGFTWGLLTGNIAQGADPDKPKNWIGELGFTDSVSLGSIIEEAISWATGYKYSLGSPWDLLNSLPLKALKLVYDFTDNTVSFKADIGEINLGFCKITGISLNYQSGKPNKEDNGVFITINGSFFWQSGDKITWDATKPETTPSPAGQGNKYFDLRLLALGQHVTIPKFADATSVNDAIQAMYDLPPTKPGEIPGIVFDSNSSWLVGMNFGILKLQDGESGNNASEKALRLADSGSESSGYFIDMQIVFNDPNLYALRIALDGAPARIFKGLDFQIMYRKISDSVGVYQAEIALPDVMRKIQLGQVNITLPVFGIEIYTNGDFLIDLGFPKNADFSRSFTLQTIIYVPFPIPVMGSAGLYFGKKSSATSTEVPVIDNGTFNPVVVFGIGIQFGLGYDFNAGILAAGFSLTFVTIIEGVIAKFNPYQAIDTSTGDQADIAPAYYYSVKGIVGIKGSLYGYVDFKIIKAEVNVQLSILADITIAAYQPILLGITASVSVSVSIKINLGFFTIKISFSFDLTLRESYSISVGGGSSPWHISTSQPQRNAMLASAGNVHSYYSAKLMATAQDSFKATPTWSNLIPPDPDKKWELTGYIGMGLSIAGDMATQPADQLAVYSAMLFINSVASAKEDPGSGLLKTQGTANDTSFELLTKQVFRWVIAAFHDGAISAGDLDNLPISKVRLQELYDYLNDADNTDPIPVSDIDSFLNDQVTMTVSHPSDNAGEADTTYFPMVPKLAMSLPAFGDQAALNYTFEDYNALSETYISDLKNYFDELAVQMQQNAQAGLKADAVVENGAESLATFIYADYFLLLARQMIQNAQSALDVYQYHLIPNQLVSDIVKFVNDNGKFETGVYSVNDLFESNKSHLLTTGTSIKVNDGTYSTVSEDTFDAVSKKAAYNNSFTAAALATLNKEVTSILQSGAQVTYPGKNDVTVYAGNSLTDLASAFEITVDQLLSASNVLTLPGLLLPSVKLLLPAINGLSQQADTLVSFAARYGVSIDALAQAAENAAIENLFDISDSNGTIVFTDLPQFMVGQLIDEIQANGDLQQLSGMASRYYLSGLRLPTAQITPGYQGMWVNSQMQYAQATAGLFALTGQQFPIPVLSKDETYTVSFSIPSSVGWMTFAGETTSLEIPIAQDTTTYTQIDTVRNYAQGNFLDLAIEQLGIGEIFSSSLGHYSFGSVSTWQAGAPLLLPYGGAAAIDQSLNIWTLPNDLINLADPVGRAIAPRFEVQTGTADPATKAIVYDPVTNYGWGTQVTFTIKRVPVSVDSPASATTYEISGADGNNALILEQMVKYLGTDDSLINQVIFTYAPNQSNGSNPGLQSDPLTRLIVGIAQANLSTFTRPDSALRSNLLMAEDNADIAYTLLNTPTALIQLLWQASITRDGGYYLYYYNSESDGGLPDHIFNDKGEAALSLITVYANKGIAEQQNLLQPCMNVFVTGNPVSVSDSTLFAQANPVAHTPSFGAMDTLNSLAYQYYTNIGDVAEDNPDAQLAQVAINVAEGTYQVTSAQGEKLQAIADNFKTTVTDIKTANPLVTNWPDVLPLYTGLRLPPLTIQPAAGINTLPAIALKYGMDLTSLAYYNGDTIGLFAANTSLVMRGGPVTRVATVPAGVLSLEAVRTEPAELPASPSDNGYAQLFLQQNFSILTFGLIDNLWFRASNPSLPAGPTDSQNAVPGKWMFRQSVPYYKFANQLSAGTNAGLPGIDTSPYKGIGYLVQANFEWCDIYGNTALTTLAQPPKDAHSIVNEVPILTGYTDALLSVNQWPSVSVAWQVADGSQPEIQLPLSFDTTPYNGLLSAKATSGTALLLTFTTAIDPDTATKLANYNLSPSLTATAAAMQGNNAVILTVSPMAEEVQYTVAIGNIKDSTTKLTYSGQATCSYPDVPAEANSSIVQQAAHDFQVYTQLWYQLTDPAGIQLSVQTSLFGEDFIIKAGTYKDFVDNWIAPIYLYLQDRSNGMTTVAPPPSFYTFTFDIHPDQVVKDQIFEVLLSFTIARTGGAIMGDFETTGNVKKVTTNISPASGSDAYQTMSLNNFAGQFESVMSEDGQYNLKIATGADRNKLGQQSPNGTIWAVRLGIADTTPLSYSIDDVGAPALFAPKPVSNKLESRSNVAIYSYNTGTGIDFNNPSWQQDFSEIDLDQWVGSFFGAIDEMLTPEFTASMQLIDEKLNVSHLKNIQDAKESLADIAKMLMTTVFDGESGDASAVQEALKQALLVKLTNLYATNSGIQFNTKVISDKPAGTPPNLYGSFLQNTVLDGAVSQSETLRMVTLHFSAPLNKTSASDAGNYALTAPLAVLSATLTADGKSVALNTSADVTIGVTTATISDQLLDNNGRPVAGNRVSIIAKDYVSYSKPDQLTITSAKIPLDGNSDQPLAFLLTTPEIVRGQDGEVLSRIDLNLSYKSADIEHQIAAPVNGFTPSSWLSFVLPATRVEPLEKQLGGLSVPMFLRSFPQNPSLVNQLGITPNTSNPDISTMLEWDYAFNYSQSFHYPQDTLNFSVEFNVGKPPVSRFMAMPDAFNQLAEFITIYPSIETDLKTLVTKIDAKVYNESGADVDKLFSNANVALTSFVQVVQHVVSAAGNGNGFTMAGSPHAYIGTGKVSYAFSLQEGPRNLDGVSVQVVSVYGAPPAGIATPQVLIEPDMYKMVPWTNEQSPCDGYVCYYYQSIADGTPLTSSVAQNIQARQIILPQLNVLQYQDALTVISLTRNQNLIPGKITSSDFVYTTGNLSFSNSYLPTITSDEEIDIANLPANQGTPTSRTLYEQFKTLMDTLLLENTQPTLSFQMQCSYDYYINADLAPVNLPVLLQTLVSINLATELYPMLQNWADYIHGWMSTNAPNQFNAALKFNLTIFSNLTQQPYPLVVLNDLSLYLSYISPNAQA